MRNMRIFFEEWASMVIHQPMADEFGSIMLVAA
jgi:hypothetical protein